MKNFREFFKRKEVKTINKIDLTTAKRDVKHQMNVKYHNDAECQQYVIDLFQYTNLGAMDMNFLPVGRAIVKGVK